MNSVMDQRRDEEDFPIMTAMWITDRWYILREERKRYWKFNNGKIDYLNLIFGTGGDEDRRGARYFRDLWEQGS